MWQRWRTIGIGLAAGLVMIGGHAANADEIELGSLKDNTLYESDAGNLSNGAGRFFFAGRTNQEPGTDIRRGLIAFDIAGQIPAGSLITNVTLTLNMSRTVAGATPVSLHRVTVDWGEGASDAEGGEGAGAPAEPGDATWLHTFYDTDFWTNEGGDFDPTASATISVADETQYNWSSAGMIDDVQSWLDNPASNFGWLVLGDESFAPSSKRFDTHENNNQNNRPVLTVVYEPPAELGACCFAGGVCENLDDDDCLAQGGEFQGKGTDCAENPCGFLTGACCFEDGSCVVLTQSECTDQGGTYQDDGTVCDPNTCPQPTGACCFNDGTCQSLTEEDCATQGGTYNGDFTECTPELCPVILEPYLEPLPIPGVMQPVSGEPGGEATYEVEMQQIQQQLHPNLPPTTLWGYEGLFPGPTIEATTDAPITVTWINDLRDEQDNFLTEHYLPVDTCLHGPDTEGNTPRTVVHLHGGHVPAEYDGYPEDTFLPGSSDTYIYPNNQLPATLWFHDHALGITRLNVMMGLAAFYIIRDDFELSLNLPTGEYEIPIVIQDRSFNPDGSLHYPAQWQDQFFGDTIVVNGKVWPYLEVNQGKYRLRLLNGSNARVYTLALSNGAPFHQIGTDGGLLPEPVTVNEITLTPAERADVIVDFAAYEPGTEIILTNSAPAPYPGSPGEGVIPEIMKFIVVDQPGDTDPVPAELRPLEVLKEADADEVRDFELRKFPEPCAGSYWLINELGWDDITEMPELGDTEIWSFINRSGVVHPMHMHLVMFQVLDRQPFEIVDGEVVPVGDPVPPAANEIGWKDTVNSPPNQITRVIARFEHYTGLFPYHCHVLEHEDHEMMRQFRVVPACPADVNDDQAVNVQDLLALLSAWGPCDDAVPCPADTNEDDTVDVADLLALLSAWGDCPQ